MSYKTKRAYALVLSLLMVSSQMPLGNVSTELVSAVTVEDSSSSGDFNYDVTSNKVTITKYIGSDSVVNIPSEINGLPVISIGGSPLRVVLP